MMTRLMMGLCGFFTFSPLMANDSLPNEVWAFHREAGGNAFNGDTYYFCTTGQYVYNSYAVLSNSHNHTYTGMYSYDAPSDKVQFLTHTLKIHPQSSTKNIPPPPQSLRFAQIIAGFNDATKDADGVVIYYKNTDILPLLSNSKINPLFYERFSRYPMKPDDIKRICGSTL